MLGLLLGLDVGGDEGALSCQENDFLSKRETVRKGEWHRIKDEQGSYMLWVAT